MSEQITVDVALENTAYHFDELYSYSVPKELESVAVPGVRVLVPFGKGSAKRQGVILRVRDDRPQIKLKNIYEVKDEKPLLYGDLIKLIFWLKDRTFCTYFDAMRCILPAGCNLKLNYYYAASPELEQGEIDMLSSDERDIYMHLLKSRKFEEKSKLLSAFGFKSDSTVLERMYKNGLLIRNVDANRTLGDLTEKSVNLLVDGDDYLRIEPSLTAKQKSVCALLQEVGSVSVKELCYFTGVTAAVVKALEQKQVVECYDSEVYRSPLKGKTAETAEKIIFTAQQQAAYDSLINRFNSHDKTVSLLYGITGSGKTQIYIKLIEYMQRQGRGAIMMVPEIALTPQIINKFYSHFGTQVAVFHSALSPGERLDEWKRVSRGEASVVIGTRSAVFAPVKNLGAIIIDEEQEHTYKSEKSPRYDARDVARFRCEENRALLVLGSATPSVESFARAKRGIYALDMLTERYANAVLPDVVTVDLCDELASGNRSSISGKLLSELTQTISAGHQAILLINRRGYNTFASCSACGKVVSCPNCSISLTYHHANDRLMCHYCGYSQPMTDCCPECGKRDLHYYGSGTQMIEEEIANLLPDARVIRMDQDTTLRKNSHEKTLKSFADGEYDILLGTQMVAKGIDFENVTLVGVISADQQLYNDDFRSLERTFSLLTQVVGRAGRGKNKGRAIIQTVTPENEIIKLSAKQDYGKFFDTEIQMRKLLTYPPFCDLCVIGFSGINENKVRIVSKLFFQNFRQLAAEKYKNQKVIVLGPVQPRIPKIANKFRYRMIIKCKNSSEFRQMISELLINFGKDTKFSDVNIFADINPESIL